MLQNCLEFRAERKFKAVNLGLEFRGPRPTAGTIVSPLRQPSKLLIGHVGLYALFISNFSLQICIFTLIGAQEEKRRRYNFQRSCVFYTNHLLIAVGLRNPDIARILLRLRKLRISPDLHGEPRTATYMKGVASRS